MPDINKVLQVGTLNYGFGINMEQEIVKNVGVFSRLGWNDGKTEDFAFTAIDRLATGGGTGGSRSIPVGAAMLTVLGMPGRYCSRRGCTA